MIVYTNAPSGYDYPYSKDQGPVGLINKEPIRKVDITDDGLGRNYQIPRYRSGLFCIWEPREMVKAAQTWNNVKLDDSEVPELREAAIDLLIEELDTCDRNGPGARQAIERCVDFILRGVSNPLGRRPTART